MKNTLPFLLAISFIFLLSSFSFAQKAGHVNFGNIVAVMPETQAADQELAQYQEELVQKGESMASDWQKNYNLFVNAVQKGKLTPSQQQQEQQSLDKEQQKILAYEQEVIQKVEQRRTQLLTPVVAKAERAVKEVAKENGYEIIFDSSIFNALLASDKSLDIEDLVRAKLGISD